MPDDAPQLDNRAPVGVPNFAVGEHLTARKMNDLAALAGVRPGFGPPRLLRPGAVTDYAIYPMRVIEEKPDYLLCVHESQGQSETLPTAGAVRVAKPYTLRLSPFHGRTRSGITYDYADENGVLQVNTRTATEAADTSHTEEQEIVPPYEGTIYATRAVPGGIAVTPPGQPRMVVEFLDLNVDGRAWGAA